MKNHRFLFFGIVSALLLATVLGGCGTTVKKAEKPEKQPTVPKQLVFKTVDINNNPVDDSILQGHKLTMVNVWGTFCGPCIEEMPDLQALYAENKGKDVNVIGIACDALEQDGREFVLGEARRITSEAGVQYTCIAPDKAMERDCWQV